MGVENLNVDQHGFSSQLNGDIQEHALWLSKKTIVSMKGGGWGLKGWGYEILPNEGWHNESGWMAKFQMVIRNWKVTDDGIKGSPWSKSKVINLESEGSTTAREDNKDFHWEGKVLKNSKVYMAKVDWDTSFTIL